MWNRKAVLKDVEQLTRLMDERMIKDKAKELTSNTSICGLR